MMHLLYLIYPMKFIIPIFNQIKTKYYITTTYERLIIDTPVNHYR